MAFDGRPLLLDSNLLVLLAVGLVDRSRIERFKRTSQFRAVDYDLLTQCVNGARELWTTAHVLAEVSNLLGNAHGQFREHVYGLLARLISETLDERTHSAVELCSNAAFSRLGLTDVGLAQVAGSQAVVLSTDLPLCLELQRLGQSAVNFNHLRSQDLLDRG